MSVLWKTPRNGLPWPPRDPGIVVSGDRNHRRRDARGEPIPQIEPRHPGQSNIEDEAIELRPLPIRAEGFDGRIGDRLHARRT